MKDDYFSKISSKSIGIIGIIISALSLIISLILSDKWPFFIISFVLLLVIIILLIRLNYYKNITKNYYEMMEQGIGEYAILNYMMDRNKRIPINDCHIVELSFEANLIGEISCDKFNDLEIIWRLKGTNTTKKELDSLYLRINAIKDVSNEDLKIECFDNSIGGGPGVECNYEFVNNEATYKLIKILPNERIKKGNGFCFLVKYIWPKSYEPHKDYFVIDTKNFSDLVDKIKFSIFADEIVITKHSRVQIYSIQENSNGKWQVENEGRISFCDGVFNKCIDNKGKKVLYIKITE